MEANSQKLNTLLKAVCYQRDQAINQLAEAFAEIDMLRFELSQMKNSSNIASEQDDKNT
jgi:hypothetical protein